MVYFVCQICWSLLLLTSAIPADHAIYIGVVQVEHRQEDKIAQINVKVFEDDLRDAVRAAYPDEYRPGAIADFCTTHRAQVARYFRRHLRCEINGAPAALSLRSGLLEQDVYLLQFTLPCPGRWKSTRIQADFFMELFPAQSNVIHLLHGQEKRFARLTRQQATITFNW